jgi:predicted acylesterase/phospholipase RssA
VKPPLATEPHGPATLVWENTKNIFNISIKEETMKKIQRAIALSGGGPPVGLQLGALKALDENDISFDVFTTDCIGSWTASIYNSHPKAVRFEKMREFYNSCFVPDEVFDGFSVPVDIFVTDYFQDSLTYLEKLLDYRTYQGLYLPQYVNEFILHSLNPTNYPRNSVDLSSRITKGMSLHPWSRLMFKLCYQNRKTGRSWLMGPDNHGEDFVKQYIDFESLVHIREMIYLNAFNLTKGQIELFINRLDHPKYKPITLRALKANSSILGYLENWEIEGDKYCEGAVADTVNFKDLLHNHPNLSEIWVINILDYKEIKPPKNPLEADLLAVELPFITIAHNNVELFSRILKTTGLDRRIKLIKMNFSYKDLDFLWKQSTLEKGIEVGYRGAMETIADYRRNSLIDGTPTPQLVLAD